MAAGDFQGTYDLTKTIFTIGGVIVSGFGEGDVLKAMYDEDRYFKKVGADGEVGRAKNPSRAGSFEVVLSQSSEANDALSSLFNLDQFGSFEAPVPVGLADLSGRTLIGASKVWIKTTPEASFGREIGERTWVFDCADLKMFIGGN